MSILLSLTYLLLPALIIYLCKRYPFLDKIGAIIIAYIIGLIMGNVGIFPSGSDIYLNLVDFSGHLSPDKAESLLKSGSITSGDVRLNQIRILQDYYTQATVPLAIPLLLFSANLRSMRSTGKSMLLSMTIAVITCTLVVLTGYFIFTNDTEDFKKLPGLLIGLYTGGTPNLAALKVMLNVDPNTYIITHTYDTVISAIYLLFLMTWGKIIFRKFLSKGSPVSGQNVSDKTILDNQNHTRSPNRGILIGILLSLSIAALSAFVGLTYIAEEFQMMFIILSITTLALLLSSIQKIRNLDKTFETGMYLIIVFCLVVASMANFQNLIHTSPIILYYILYAIFGTLILHVALSRIFRIDADTVIITSTTLICSPPFVPVIAASLSNKSIIAGGITIGIFGYAIGNYIGVFIYQLL